MIAAAQVGRHAWDEAARQEEGREGKEGGGRVSYGHSMIVSPWGEIVAEAGGIEEWDKAATCSPSFMTATTSSDDNNADDAAFNGLGPGACQPALILADITLEAVEDVRRGMPLEGMARRDVVDVVQRSR